MIVLCFVYYLPGAAAPRGGGGNCPPMVFDLFCCYMFLLVSSAVDHVHDDTPYGFRFFFFFFCLSAQRSIMSMMILLPHYENL